MAICHRRGHFGDVLIFNAVGAVKKRRFRKTEIGKGIESCQTSKDEKLTGSMLNLLHGTTTELETPHSRSQRPL